MFVRWYKSLLIIKNNIVDNVSFSVARYVADISYTARILPNFVKTHRTSSWQAPLDQSASAWAGLDYP